MLKPRPLLLVAMVVAMAAFAAPTSALAATTRYAAPSPKGSADCSSADNACDLPTAIGGASNGDTVVVTPGTYSWTASAPFKIGVSLVGQPGPRPVIDMGGTASLGTWLGDSPSSTSISNLDLESTSSASPLYTTQSAVSHLVVRFNTTASGIYALTVGGPFKDSLVQSTGPSADSGVEAAGSSSSPTAMVNDTVVARGSGSIGVDVRSSAIFVPPCISNQSYATLENVIAHGDMVGLATSASASGPCTAPVSVASVGYSNYDGVAANNGTPANTGHNQTDPASTNLARLFASPATNLHERAGAPTIDAASTAAIESTDLDGNPRVQGSAPDMGAYETARPPVRCVVPKLTGKALRRARKLLAAAHCALGKVNKPKHKRGKLVVRSQSSRKGTVLADGASVSVKLGPTPRHRKRH